ncbi:MAG: NADPH-dependent glutamate synthase, partial [Candidatus Krumholzibacteria bacterium]|nr:NADPH-dependent glutamate synthase [Candidatus Krumholzibacteria bacterium]
MACMNGEWLKPLALRDVYETRKMCGPDAILTGTGGITTWSDAVEMMMCGADLIGICTATLVYGFGFMPEFIHGFKQFLAEKGYKQPQDIRDILVPAITSAPDLTIYAGNARIKDANLAAPCTYACPNSVPAQGYVRNVAAEEFEEAYQLIMSRSPLQSICGKVCDHPCEAECVRGLKGESVAVGHLERFVADWARKHGLTGEQEKVDPTGFKVAVVGAGPAGLTAAGELARMGHEVTIFEALHAPGGVLRYGIPEFRLPENVIDYEVGQITKLGVRIECNVIVGKTITLGEIRDQFDACFIANGAGLPVFLNVPGENLNAVYSANEFLVRVNLMTAYKDGPERTPIIRGRRVVVIGGGNTAMDAVRTSKRLGAEKAMIFYRRTEAEMPARVEEIRHAKEEGVEFHLLEAPTEILGSDGWVSGIRMQKMELGEPDDSGRRRPIPLEGSEFDLPCQLAVSAIGQAPVLDGLTEVKGRELELTRWNTIVVDTETMETNIEGVFAGGDAADDGPTVVIDAVRDGQRAAKAIHAYLAGRELPRKPFAVAKEFWSKPGTAELGEVKESPRHEVHMIDVEERRNNFREVSTGFEYEDNVHECDRCLSCGCIRFDDCDLRRYAEEYGIDMDRFKGYVRRHKVDERHPYIVYDPNKCILCARCIRTCARVLPISAIGLVGRGFRTEMRPAMDDPLVETNCVSCGNCVDSCPTGALTVKYPFPGRASLYTDDVPTRCGFCSLACPITVKRFGDNRYYVGSSGVAGEYLCRYGRFGYELFIKKKRITSPEIRRGSAGDRTDMNKARELIVSSMKKLADKYGSEKVGVFVSPELTNEELYLAGRIAREGLGTSNVASLSILGTGKGAGALDESFGYTASTSDRTCIEGADLIICNNTSMESDHLILAVEVIQAVKAGAKLIVSNSTLDTTDQLLSTLAMDPMRGRATVFWNGVMQVLLDEGYFNSELVKAIPGAKEFLAKREFEIESASNLSGIDAENLNKAAEIIRGAGKIVFIHSPDRTQDQAPGDMETLANFIVLLRAVGVEANLLLPRIISNSAALEVMGADPVFAPGRVMSPDAIAGARSHEELREILAGGEIRAALVIGEDPMAWGPTGSWFRNVEFLAAMDWTNTETTQYADVVLPGSTFLETGGTRCNFEGKLIEFSRAVEPPAGVSGREVLEGLAAAFGIETEEDTSAEIRRIVQEKLGELSQFYWNTGQKRVFEVKMRLVATDDGVRTGSIQPPLTHGERYKKEIREVGTDRFKVRC